MAAPIFEEDEVSQEIDLEDEFGVDLKGNKKLKESIGQAIIDRIRDRTSKAEGIKFGESGRASKFNLASVPYSKDYKQSPEFKAFGKTNKVNMKLTGDMLGLMDIKQIQGNKIVIGWQDKEENAKAYNHSVGDTVKPRPFFGISKTELKEIKSEFRDQLKDLKKDGKG